MSRFKIGEIVICTSCDEEFFQDRIFVGQKYKIEDIDFHFPGKIAIKLKGPYYNHHEFVPDKFFDNQCIIREDKINQILDEDKMYKNIWSSLGSFFQRR